MMESQNDVVTEFFLWDIEEFTFLIMYILYTESNVRENRERERKRDKKRVRERERKRERMREREREREKDR